MRVYKRIRNYDKLIQLGPKRKIHQELSSNRLSWRQRERWHHYHMWRILLLSGSDILSDVTK